MRLKHLLPNLIFIATLFLPRVTKGQLALTVHTINPSCGLSNGQIALIATGGTPPYTYFFGSANNGSTSILTQQGPQTIIAKVQDAGGASVSQTVTLIQTIPPVTLVYPALQVNPSGCSTSDGSITLSATGGTPPYLFSSDGETWQASNTYANLSGELEGSFYFVKDANGCMDSIQAIVGITTCNIWVYAENYPNMLPDCGKSDGYIYITGVNGSSPPFTFSRDGVHYQNSGNFDNLPAGKYAIDIKDANGYILTRSYVIAENCHLATSYTATIAGCGQSNATLTISATNGVAPYTYSLDGVNFQTNNVFSNLAANTYKVTIKDANGAPTMFFATVYDDCPVVTATVTDATCTDVSGAITDNTDGSITASGSNGTAPYQYSLDGVNYQTSPLFANLAVGAYTLYVKDAHQNLSTTTVNVGTSCFYASAQAAPMTCGVINGGITITAGNGTPPYSYSLDGTSFQAGDVFSPLPAGNYPNITVKDAGGLHLTIAPVTIQNKPGPTPAVAPTSATCANNDGSLLASATGFAPFQYSLDGTNYQGSGQFSTLVSGPGTLWVKDADGCIASTTYTIGFHDDLTVSVAPVPTICQGITTTITAESNGDRFSWSPAVGLNDPTLLSPTATPATTTQYTLTAYKGPLCQQTIPVTINVNPAPVADAGQDQQVCYEASTRLQGSGGQCSWSPATWLDDPNSPDPMVTAPRQTITYSLTVTAANGCASIQPATVTINVTPQALVFAGNDTAVLKGQSVPLNAVDLNQAGFISYSWTPATGLSDPTAQAPTATPPMDITYTVLASTQAGCTATSSITVDIFEAVGIFVPSGFTPNGDGHNDLLRAIPMGIHEFNYFAVYNRWGQLVFRTTDPSKGWDGMIQGQAEAAGTFVWMAAGVDYHGNLVQRRGTTILIR